MIEFNKIECSIHSIKEKGMTMPKSNQKLVDDVKVVMSDLEGMLDDVKGKTAKEFAEMQTSLSKKLAKTKQQLIDSEIDLSNKEKVAAEMTDDFARNNTWKLVAGAIVIGFLIGYSF